MEKINNQEDKEKINDQENKEKQTYVNDDLKAMIAKKVDQLLKDKINEIFSSNEDLTRFNKNEPEKNNLQEDKKSDILDLSMHFENKEK